MLPLANTPARYGAVAVLLHWGMAALLLLLAGLGWYMAGLPDTGYDRVKITLILAHKAIGMIALAIVLARLAWRLAGVLPQLAARLPFWQQVAARFVHLWFYALLLALPLTGWLMSSAGGYPVPFFDWFALPDLIGENQRWFAFLIDLHRWLADALVLLVVVHAGAALRHHFALRDDTLRRMLP